MPSHKTIVLLALLAGCAPSAKPSSAVHIDTLPNGAVRIRSDAPRWDEGTGWKVAQALSIVSPEDGNGFFQRVTAIAADPAGRIYILDGQNSTIQQFNATGQWIRQIGRKGGGPGEFAGPIGLAIRGSQLYVVDQTNVRISVFDTSGAFVTSHPRSFANMGTWRWEGGLDTAGTIYDLRGQFSDSGQTWDLVRLGPDSFNVSDSFPLPSYEVGATLVKKSGGGISRQTMILPNTPMLARQLDPRGYLWFGIGNKYQIVQRRLTGDTVRIVERAWTPSPISDSARAQQDSMVASLRSQGYTLPEISTTVPAFRDLVLDDASNLWVGPYGWRDSVWQVFDAEGVWLGPVTFPGTMHQLRFRGDSYYGLTLDSLDIEHVVQGTVAR